MHLILYILTIPYVQDIITGMGYGNLFEFFFNQDVFFELAGHSKSLKKATL